MNNKETYKEVFDKIKPSKELLEHTSKIMKEELHVERRAKSNNLYFGKTKLALVTFSLVVVLGYVGISDILKNNTSLNLKQKDSENIEVDNEDIDDNSQVREPMAKVAVNISGIVAEISEDGNKIKVGEQWIVINENTHFEDDPDNGVEAVSKEFKVGNRIAGFTLDDADASEVTALTIYSNDKNKIFHETF